MAAGKRGIDKLKKKEAKKVKCLCCDRPFMSRGPHNKICNDCRISSDYKNGAETEDLRILTR